MTPYPVAMALTTYSVALAMTSLLVEQVEQVSTLSSEAQAMTNYMLGTTVPSFWVATALTS
jgi:hypothetical protein